MRTSASLLVTVVAAVLVVTGTALPPRACGYAIELNLTWTGSDYWVELYVEDPGGSPEWVGYDIRRTVFVECGAEVLLNEDVLPRQAGSVTVYTLTDADYALQVYGQVNCQDCGTEGCITAELTEVVPIDYAADRQRATWGALKATYR